MILKKTLLFLEKLKDASHLCDVINTFQKKINFQLGWSMFIFISFDAKNMFVYHQEWTIYMYNKVKLVQ